MTEHAPVYIHVCWGIVCAFIKTDLRAEHLNCQSILPSLILLLAIVCKEAQWIGPIITQSMGKLLQNAYITITSSNNSFKWITWKGQKIRHPPGLSDRSHTRPILYDAVRWWSDNTKLSGHPTIRYLWTCHHSALLITCTLVNLSSVICCHYLMTMALACIQATQRHQAIVRLNHGGGDLQYRKAEYSMASEHEAQRKGKTSNVPIVSRQQREKKVANASFCFQANTASWAR